MASCEEELNKAESQCKKSTHYNDHCGCLKTEMDKCKAHQKYNGYCWQNEQSNHIVHCQRDRLANLANCKLPGQIRGHSCSCIEDQYNKCVLGKPNDMSCWKSKKNR